jgi:LAO/AO transport system kinase
VETVGVGQAEVEVATATDTTLVVVSPGWGDAVQVSKAGILEIADVFVVNKADRDGVEEAARDLRLMLRMGPKTDWTPPIVRTSTVTGEGVEELWGAIESHRAHQESTGSLAAKRDRRIVEEIKGMVAERLRQRAATFIAEDLELLEELRTRRLDPYEAAGRVVSWLGPSAP